MLSNITKVLKQCKLCKKYRKSPIFQKSVIPCSLYRPFKSWALDIVGPMHMRGLNSKTYIITAIDYATRWPVAQEVKQHTGANVQQIIGKEIISWFGAPELLITNRGPKLVTSTMKSYLGTTR